MPSTATARIPKLPLPLPPNNDAATSPPPPLSCPRRGRTVHPRRRPHLPRLVCLAPTPLHRAHITKGTPLLLPRPLPPPPHPRPCLRFRCGLERQGLTSLRLRPDDAGGKCGCAGAGGAEEEGGGARFQSEKSLLFSAFLVPWIRRVPWGLREATGRGAPSSGARVG